MRDALLVIDVITDFAHDDGERLLASFRRSSVVLARRLREARADGVPVVYVNDGAGMWDWDVASHLGRIVEHTPGGEVVAAVAPRPGEVFLRKPRYSAFDHTPLALVLRELGVERVLLAGAAAEMCIVQTAIDARELGLKVTILAAACAAVDTDDADLALRYAERVVGAHIDRD
jgi:nicotinamidase-related amidase